LITISLEYDDALGEERARRSTIRNKYLAARRPRSRDEGAIFTHPSVSTFDRFTYQLPD
jgi:hypothetical protein